MKLIPYPHVNQLFESMQVNEVRFAFTNKQDNGDYQLITNFVKCREYFNEFLMKNHHPKEFDFKEVYGFVYKYEEYPYNMKNPSIAIKLPKKDMYPVFVKNLEFLNAIEDFNGMEKTFIVETSEATTRGVSFVLEFSPTWINSCILFNIYTLLIKLATLDIKHNSIKNLTDVFKHSRPSEITYVESITTKVFNAILNNLKALMKLDNTFVDGFSQIRAPYDVHGNSGLIAFIKYAHCMKDSPLLTKINEVIMKEPTVKFVL